MLKYKSNQFDHVTCDWVILIETDKYAGNFERDMCAFCTGQTGECGVGEEYARQFEKEVGFDKDANGNEVDWFDLTGVAGDRGCHRPCSMFMTNGEHHTVAIYSYSEPTAEQINLLRERAHLFTKIDHMWPGIMPTRILGMSVVNIKREITEKAIPI